MDLVRLRYVGSDRMRVPKLNRVVEPDELVGVPADVYERYAWPESQWHREETDQQSSAAPAAAKTRRAGQGDA